MNTKIVTTNRPLWLLYEEEIRGQCLVGTDIRRRLHLRTCISRPHESDPYPSSDLTSLHNALLVAKHTTPGLASGPLHSVFLLPGMVSLLPNMPYLILPQGLCTLCSCCLA